MLLLELFNSQTILSKKIVLNTLDEYVVDFQINKDQTFRFMCEQDDLEDGYPEGASWNMSFATLGESVFLDYGATNNQDAIRVLSAVKELCMEFVQRHSSCTRLVFTGSTINKSRTKLYTRIVSSLRIPGWIGAKLNSNTYSFTKTTS